MGDNPMPINVPELIDWLDATYPLAPLTGSEPHQVDEALRRAGQRQLIADLQAQLKHLQESA